jgi:hypothetical protein
MDSWWREDFMALEVKLVEALARKQQGQPVALPPCAFYDLNASHVPSPTTLRCVLAPRNRLSPRYSNIATTPIQQFEHKKMLGQRQKTYPKKRNGNKGEATQQ